MMDIDKLIAAVEEGDADFLASDGWIEAWDAVAPSLQTYRMKSDGESAAIISYAAYTGSLDAAQRLHDALLHGWEVWLKQRHEQFTCGVAWDGIWHATVSADAATPARAWLLAILRAVKAQEAK